MNENQKKRGFTLIELLIVVAIIAILAAIAVPNFLEAQMRAKVVSVKSDMRNIINGMAMYRADNEDYPDDEAGSSWQNDFLPLIKLTTPIAYLHAVPTNPFFDKSKVERGNFSYWRDHSGVNAGVNGRYESKRYQIFYSLTSVGPDGANQMTPVAAEIGERKPTWLNTVYNPTNGTKSIGDLHCSNLGVSE